MKRRGRRIYILPTRFGLVFIVGSLLMILIGSAYQNNLVNMLAYFMLSLVFICMIQTQNNLKDVRVETVETGGGFAGGEFLATTLLVNDAKVARYNLETKFRDLKQIAVYENNQTLLSRGSLKLRATYPAVKRGVYEISEARLSSVYPLGLFEAWTWFGANAQYFVYPTLEGDRPCPPGSNTDRDGIVSHAVGGEDFHGHRKHFQGDSYRHVDWKARARGRPLLVKQFIEGAPGACTLDWDSLPGVAPEQRLSQLAKWIEEAKEKKIVFSVSLPNVTVPPGQGLSHAIRCWQLLAAHDSERSHAPSR